MMSRLDLFLRGTLEAGIIAALGCWGITQGAGTAMRVVLGLAAPLVVFGIWGAIDFRGAGRAAEGLRLAEELLLSGVAAVALYAAGCRALARSLLALSVVHHALVYARGGRLLKERT